MSKDDSSKENSQKKVMAAIIASLENLCRIKLPDSAYIDFAINSISIQDLIKQADAGDKDAEERMRHLAFCYLSSDTFGPIPAALRAYAARELKKLSKGTPDSNRPAGGSPPHTYREKLWIAHWIHIAKQSMSQNLACAAFVAFINKKCCEDEALLSLDGVTQNRACEAFIQRSREKCHEGEDALSPEQARKIYVEAKLDIEALYEEVRKIKATVVPIRHED